MNIHSVNEAVFGGQYARYFFFHGRYVLLNTLTFLAVLAVEFFWLKTLVSPKLLGAIIFLRVLSVTIVDGWWGALEPLRAVVRRRLKFYDAQGAKTELSCWLITSLIIGMLVSLIAGSFLFKFFGPFSGIENLVFILYLTGFIMQGVLGLFWKTYKAGIPAASIGHSPLYVICGERLIAIVAFPLLWYSMGLIGFPLAYLLGIFLKNGLNFFLKRRWGSNLKIPSQQILGDFFKKFPLREFMWSFAGGLSLCLGIVAFLIFFQHLNPFPEMLFSLFVLSQLYRADVHGVLNFENDLRTVQRSLGSFIYGGFRRRVVFFVLFLSLVSLALAMIAFPFLFSTPRGAVVAPLIIFFSGGALLAFIQIKAFIQHSFKALLLSSICGLLLLWMAVGLFSNIVLIWVVASLPVLVGILLKYMLSWRGFNEVFLGLDVLDSVYLFQRFGKESILMHKIVLYPTISRAHALGFINQLYRFLPFDSLICPINFNELFVFEIKKKTKLDVKALAQLSAGIIKDYQHFTVEGGEGVRELIANIFKAHVEDNSFIGELKIEKFAGLNDLAMVDRLFKEYFPSGRIVDETNFDEFLSGYSLVQKMEVANAVDYFSAKPLTINKSRQFFASVFEKAQGVKLYVIPKEHFPIKQLFDWDHMVHFFNFKK